MQQVQTLSNQLNMSIKAQELFIDLKGRAIKTHYTVFIRS